MKPTQITVHASHPRLPKGCLPCFVRFGRQGNCQPCPAGYKCEGGAGTRPFQTVCLPLSYSGNPGVNGVSDRGATDADKEPCDPGWHAAGNRHPPTTIHQAIPPPNNHPRTSCVVICCRGVGMCRTPPLQHRLLTPELQWQCRGQMAYITGTGGCSLGVGLLEVRPGFLH